MSASVFDHVCSELERRTCLDRLAARGTVRLALRAAGLEPRSVDVAQMRVVLERLMTGELRQRGVEDPEGVCRDVASSLTGCSSEGAADSPEAVFRRLARG